MSTPRLAAAWLALYAGALVVFVGVNAAAALRHGRGQVGDLLVSLLLLVVAAAALRTARELWTEASGHRHALVLLATAAVGALWLSAQAPFGWIVLGITVGLGVAVVRDTLREP